MPLVVVRAISDKPCAEGRVVTTTLSRRRPPATAPASPRAWLSFRPCAPGPFFMLGPRRAGALSKAKCRAEVLSVGPECSMAVVFCPSSGGLFLGAVDSPTRPLPFSVLPLYSLYEEVRSHGQDHTGQLGKETRRHEGQDSRASRGPHLCRLARRPCPSVHLRHRRDTHHLQEPGEPVPQRPCSRRSCG